MRFIFSYLFITLIFCNPTFAENDKKASQPKEALSEVQKKLESMKKALGSAQVAHQDAADALKESELAISKANKKLYEINELQKKNKQKLSKLSTETQATEEKLNAQQQLLSGQLYQQYTQGEQNQWQIILDHKQPSAVARDLHYFSYLAKARATLIKKMQVNLDELKALNEKTANTLEEVTTLKKSQMAEKQTLQKQKLAKSEIVSQLSTQIAEQRNEIKKLSRDEKNLSALITRLAKQALEKEKKRQLSLKASKKPQSEKLTDNPIKPPKEVVARNDEEPTAEFSGVHFSSLKGKLRLPVRGNLINRFGNSREDTGISWKGLFIQASEGAEVKSVAVGRVVFADWMRGFGNLIIVDHGQGYMSLYGNNQALLKSVGTVVNAGDVIAAVGNSGGNETNGLYYELRKQSRPFDPLSWSNLN